MNFFYSKFCDLHCYNIYTYQAAINPRISLHLNNLGLKGELWFNKPNKENNVSRTHSGGRVAPYAKRVHGRQTMLAKSHGS